MTTEYRIRAVPNRSGGYSGGILGRTWDQYTDAEEALHEYTARVMADTFLPTQHRREHTQALRIESRTVTDWHPIPDPRGGTPPPGPLP